MLSGFELYPRWVPLTLSQAYESCLACQHLSPSNIEFSQSLFNGTDAYTEGLGDIWSFQFVFD